MRNGHKLATEAFDTARLRDEIISEAMVVNIPIGAAKPIASNVAQRVAAWVTKRPMVTEQDLNLRIATELEKYSKDLAYVYQNRGKII